MKTLDEVIDNFEKACDLERRCEGCSGCLDKEYGCPNDGAESVPDALHYLKNYRDTKEWLDLEKRNYAEAVKNCERAEAKYTQMILDMNRNEPLTWDELKAMEGKPVWVEILSDEIDLSSRWMMVARETKAHSLPLAYTDDMGHWIYGHEDDLGKTWQAYRKERG